MGRNAGWGAAARRGLAVLVTLVLAVGLAACGGPLPLQRAVTGIRLPTYRSCGRAQDATSRDDVVPVRVLRPAHLGVVVTAAVCIDGQGPFTFVVDTGSSVSLIDASLAARLHLALHGDIRDDTFGCARSLSVAAPARLSLGGVRLARQAVAVGTVRSPLLPGLGGLIGSDILSRFGAVRLDFATRRLTLQGPEGPVARPVTGDGSTALGPALTAGTTTTIAARVTALTAPVGGAPDLDLTSVQVTVPVAVGDQQPERWVVDTGASNSLMSTATARAAGLRVGDPHTGYGGLDCRLSIDSSTVSSWRLAGTPLGRQAVQVMPLGDGLGGGLLGAGTLARYGPLVVDYRAGDLLLDLPRHRRG